MSFIITGQHLHPIWLMEAISPLRLYIRKWALLGNWVPSCGYLRKFTISFPFSKSFHDHFHPCTYRQLRGLFIKDEKCSGIL